MSQEIKIDMRVAELLASRLCHDIVGPIGAVNNGMELMADESLGMADDALELASNSAAQAAAALQFFRLAYGTAGGQVEGGFSTVERLARDYLGFHKCDLTWAAEVAGPAVPESAGKLILNMLSLASEGLPRGGTLSVCLAQPSPAVVEVLGVGADAGLRQEITEGMADGVAVDDLTPRSVHGYFTQRVAERSGVDLVVEMPTVDAFRIVATLPAGA